MLKDLSKRSTEPELMDDFQEGLDSLRIVFDDINRVNRVLGGNAVTINAMARLIKSNPNIKYLNKDILKLDTTQLQCDILINTLCMHHFTNAQLVTFLKKFIELGKIGIVINDLHRSGWAYYLFKLFSVIFIKTKVAKIDGLISISKGFVKSDLMSYAKRLPSVTHQIEWKWAFRYVWIMQPIN